MFRALFLRWTWRMAWRESRSSRSRLLWFSLSISLGVGALAAASFAVDKLQSAGQLRAGLLIRAIREKRLSLFEHGLATLGGFTVGQVRSALAASTPEALYYACAAVGIDRAVFPTLLIELRKLNGSLPGDQGEAVWLRGSLSQASAARAFKALVGGEHTEVQTAV
jgi:uncharacterized protein (DUF2336 family)